MFIKRHGLQIGFILFAGFLAIILPVVVILPYADSVSEASKDMSVARNFKVLSTNFWFYFPLGVIGLWRWSAWLLKKICAQFYRPILPKDHSSETLGIVVPVYKENPELFKKALESWHSNRPDELIVVIDKSDVNCIDIFKEFAQYHPYARLIVTSTPGKRDALARGIAAGKTSIVALVDSDVIWSPQIRENVLAPFADKSIGGVTVRQKAYQSQSIWQKVTEILWDQRNHDEWPAQTAMGRALTCLSGRTSLYRRHIILPKLDDFLNEYILFRKKESGEDKCLTRLIQKDGWKTYYQSNALVYSQAASDFKTFLGQRIRWTRNSCNSDLKSLWEGWALKRPYLAFCIFDRFISMFTLLVSPIVFGLSLYLGHYLLSLSIVGIWVVGRGIKLIPHFRHRPMDLLILPAYIGINFLMALVRLYALVTMREQKWIRTAGRTVSHKRAVKKIKDLILTGEIICSIVFLVMLVI